MAILNSSLLYNILLKFTISKLFMLLSNSFILSCYLNYIFVTFGSFLNSCCNVEYVFYSRERIFKKLTVEEICNKSAYSYTLLRDVTKTRNGERGTGNGERGAGAGNGSLGTSCQRKPP